MDREEVLVRSAGEGEGMVFLGLYLRAGEADPLPRQDFHIGRSVELHFDNITWKQDCLENVKFHISGPDCDNLIKSVNDARNDEENPELRIPGDSCQAMNAGEKIQNDIELVDLPEEVKCPLPNKRMGIDENGAHDGPESDSTGSWQSLEQPVRDIRLSVTAEAEFLAETMQMFQRLRSNVVEVYKVATAVENREEQSRASTDLVKNKVGVQGYVLIECPFLHLCYEISTNSQEEDGVTPGH